MEENTDNNIEVINLRELTEQTGKAEELEPRERARFKLAAWILAALAAIFILSAVGLLYSPDKRVEDARTIFDFVSTFTLPIATLVIGFYFNGENSR